MAAEDIKEGKRGVGGKKGWRVKGVQEIRKEGKEGGR